MAPTKNWRETAERLKKTAARTRARAKDKAEALENQVIGQIVHFGWGMALGRVINREWFENLWGGSDSNKLLGSGVIVAILSGMAPPEVRRWTLPIADTHIAVGGFLLGEEQEERAIAEEAEESASGYGDYEHQVAAQNLRALADQAEGFHPFPQTADAYEFMN